MNGDPVLSRASLSVPATAPRRAQRLVTNLPTDLLRSFIAIVDAGSMAQATDRIFLTQSALSLQMKRLEDLLQQRLFDRKGRALRLAAAGEELVGLARQLLAVNDRIVASLGVADEPAPIQLGLVQDFAETALPRALPAFRLHSPEARLQLRIGGSAELGELFERARLDLAIVYGSPGEPRQGSMRRIGQEDMVWIGDPAQSAETVLPLVLLEQPCAFRNALLDMLDRTGRRYRIVLETPHLPGLTVALKAGLGLTCRTRSYAGYHDLPLCAGALPALPRIDCVLLRRERLSSQAARLAQLLELACTDEAAPGQL